MRFFDQLAQPVIGRAVQAVSQGQAAGLVQAVIRKPLLCSPFKKRGGCLSVHSYRALCAVLLAVVVTLSASPAAARRQKGATKDAAAEQAAGTAQPAAPAGAKVDINTATEKELEALPGVGKATAKKIIAGRPYSSVDDLGKAGVSAKTVDRLKSQVTAGGTMAQPVPKVAPAPVAPAAPAQPAAKKDATAEQAAGTAQQTAPAGAKVDLNTATEKDLEALPGVGKATAKKIITGRPYSSADDLGKAGVSAKTIERLKSQVTVGGTMAQPAPKVAPAPAQPAASKSVATPQKAAVETGALPAQVPPQAGMVWVNLDSKVFHHEGSRWYGKTKNGKFMTEAEAVAAGYREAKTHTKKPQ